MWVMTLCGALPHGFLPFAIWKLMDVSMGDKKLACGRQLQISIWNPLFNVGVLNGCLISKLRQSHSTRVPAWDSHSSSKLASGSPLPARRPVSWQLGVIGFGWGFQLFITGLFMPVFTKSVPGLVSPPPSPGPAVHGSLTLWDHRLAQVLPHTAIHHSPPLQHKLWHPWQVGAAALPSTGTHTSPAPSPLLSLA